MIRRPRQRPGYAPGVGTAIANGALGLLMIAAVVVVVIVLT